MEPTNIFLSVNLVIPIAVYFRLVLLSRMHLCHAWITIVACEDFQAILFLLPQYDRGPATGIHPQPYIFLGLPALYEGGCELFILR
jgi:hypothetical protein